MCCYILWKEMGESLIACEFLYLYQLKRDSGKKDHLGWYYASSRDGLSIIERDRKTYVAKFWTKKWFFAKNWESPSSSIAPPIVSTSYATLGFLHVLRDALFIFLLATFNSNLHLSFALCRNSVQEENITSVVS